MSAPMQDQRYVGDYRGDIWDFALIEKKDSDGKFNGLSLLVKVRASEVWMTPDGATEPAWLDCSSWDVHGEGYIVLITKAGKVVDGNIQRLLNCANWDGDFESLAEHSWEPKPVRFSIGANTYNNQTTYRLDWINDYDSVPGGGGNVDADRAKSLNSQYGAALRALRGNLDRAAKAAPSGKPATPPTPSPGASGGKTRPKPRPATTTAPATPEAAPMAPQPSDDIPF